MSEGFRYKEKKWYQIVSFYTMISQNYFIQIYKETSSVTFSFN